VDYSSLYLVEFELSAPWVNFQVSIKLYLAVEFEPSAP
jgi:hypothetical protein